MTSAELVTIERVGEHWDAIVWDGLVKLGAASGASPQAALQNAAGVVRRRQNEDGPPKRAVGPRLGRRRQRER